MFQRKVHREHGRSELPIPNLGGNLTYTASRWVPTYFLNWLIIMLRRYSVAFALNSCFRMKIQVFIHQNIKTHPTAIEASENL